MATYDSDQAEIDAMPPVHPSDNGQLDAISINNSDLNNNIGGLRSAINTLSQNVVNLSKSTFSMAKEVGRSATKDLNVDKQGMGMRMAASAAGPFGAIIAKAISDSGIGERIGGAVKDGVGRGIGSISSKVKSMFGGRDRYDSQSGYLDPASMSKSITNGNAPIVKELHQGVSTPLVLANEIAKQQLEEEKTGNKGIISSVTAVNKSIVAEQEQSQESTQSIVNAINELGQKFTDSTNKNDGIFKSIFRSTRLGTLFSGKYVNDIQKSTNPMETQVSVLLQIYRWQRLYGELMKQQMNELIRLQGGEEKDVVGQHGVLKSLYLKKSKEIKKAMGPLGGLADLIFWDEESRDTKNRFDASAGLTKMLEHSKTSNKKGFSKLKDNMKYWWKNTPDSVFSPRDGMTEEEWIELQRSQSNLKGSYDSMGKMSGYLNPELRRRNFESDRESLKGKIPALKQKLSAKKGFFGKTGDFLLRRKSRLKNAESKLSDIESQDRFERDPETGAIIGKKDNLKTASELANFHRKDWAETVDRPKGISGPVNQTINHIFSGYKPTASSGIKSSPSWDKNIPGTMPGSVPVTIVANTVQKEQEDRDDIKKSVMAIAKAEKSENDIHLAEEDQKKKDARWQNAKNVKKNQSSVFGMIGKIGSFLMKNPMLLVAAIALLLFPSATGGFVKWMFGGVDRFFKGLTMVGKMKKSIFNIGKGMAKYAGNATKAVTGMSAKAGKIIATGGGVAKAAKTISVGKAAKDAAKGLEVVKFGKGVATAMKGGKGIMSALGGTALKTVGKVVAKGGIKAVLKRIPIVGSILSLIFAFNRFRKGEVRGGIIELLSGAAGLLDLIVPGVGTGLSLVLDLLNVFLDKKAANASKAANSLQGKAVKELQQKKPEQSNKWLRRIPVIGGFVRMYDSFGHFKNKRWGKGIYDLTTGLGGMMDLVIPGMGTGIMLLADIVKHFISKGDEDKPPEGKKVKEGQKNISKAADHAAKGNKVRAGYYAIKGAKQMGDAEDGKKKPVEPISKKATKTGKAVPIKGQFGESLSAEDNQYLDNKAKEYAARGDKKGYFKLVDDYLSDFKDGGKHLSGGYKGKYDFYVSVSRRLKQQRIDPAEAFERERKNQESESIKSAMKKRGINSPGQYVWKPGDKYAQKKGSAKNVVYAEDGKKQFFKGLKQTGKGVGQLAMAGTGLTLATETAKGIGRGAYDTLKYGLAAPLHVVSGAVKGVGQAGWGAIKGTGQAIGGVAKGLGQAGWGAIKGVGQAGWGVLEGAGNVAKGVGSAIWNPLAGIGKGLWKGGVKGVGGGLVDVLKGNVDQGVDKILKGIGTAALETVKGFGKGAWGLIKGVGKGAWSVVKGLGKGVWSLTKGIGKGLWSAAKGVTKGVWSLATGVVKGAWTAVKGVGKGVVSLAKATIALPKNIAKGLWTGAKKTVKAFRDAPGLIYRGAKNMIKGAWNWLTGKKKPKSTNAQQAAKSAGTITIDPSKKPLKRKIAEIYAIATVLGKKNKPATELRKILADRLSDPDLSDKTLRSQIISTAIKRYRQYAKDANADDFDGFYELKNTAVKSRKRTITVGKKAENETKSNDKKEGIGNKAKEAAKNADNEKGETKSYTLSFYENGQLRKIKRTFSTKDKFYDPVVSQVSINDAGITIIRRKHKSGKTSTISSSVTIEGDDPNMWTAKKKQSQEKSVSKIAEEAQQKSSKQTSQKPGLMSRMWNKAKSIGKKAFNFVKNSAVGKLAAKGWKKAKNLWNKLFPKKEPPKSPVEVALDKAKEAAKNRVPWYVVNSEIWNLVKSDPNLKKYRQRKTMFEKIRMVYNDILLKNDPNTKKTEWVDKEGRKHTKWEGHISQIKLAEEYAKKKQAGKLENGTDGLNIQAKNSMKETSQKQAANDISKIKVAQGELTRKLDETTDRANNVSTNNVYKITKSISSNNTTNNNDSDPTKPFRQYTDGIFENRF